MYKIKIKKIKIFAYHGVNKEENENGQYFLINATIHVNEDPALLKDDINLTISYASINKMIINITTEQTFQLIETLASTIADKILSTFSNIRLVKIKISKPNAPMRGVFKNVSVTVKKNKK